MGYLSISPDLALQWFCLDNAGVMFISPSFFAFSASLTNTPSVWPIRLGYGIASALAVGAALGFPMDGVRQFYWGYFPQWSMVRSLPSFLFFFGFMTYAFLILTRKLKASESEKERNQIRYVLAAFGIAYFGSIDYLATFGKSVYPFGFIPICGLVSILFYAVVKHNLMNITVIIRKTLVYSSVMGTLTIVYLAIIGAFAHLFEGFTGYQTIFSSAVAAGLITLLFQPLRKYVQAIVDKKFFRQYVDREEKLYELSRDVVTHTSPEEMAKALRNVLHETFHPKSGALFLRSSDGTGFSAAKTWGNIPSETISLENALIRYFSSHPQPFVLDSLSDTGTLKNTRGAQVKRRAA